MKKSNGKLKVERLIIGTEGAQEWNFTHYRFLHSIDTAINHYLKTHKKDYSLDGFIKWSNSRWKMIRVEKVVT